MSDTICSRCNEKPAAICISCLTDCTESLKQQPPAGEFTKDVRTLLDSPSDESVKEVSYIDGLETLVRMACDRLDRVEAINKDLLTRLEKTTKYLEIRTKKQSKFSIPRLVDNIIEGNRAAIAKDKKEKKHGGCWPEAKKVGG